MKKNNIAHLLEGSVSTDPGRLNRANEVAVNAAKNASKNPQDPALRALANKTAMDAKQTALQQTIAKHQENVKDSATVNFDPVSGEKTKTNEASDVMVEAINNAVDMKKAQLQRNIEVKRDSIESIDAAADKKKEAINKSIEASEKQLDLLKSKEENSSSGEQQPATNMAEAELRDKKKDEEELELSSDSADTDADNLTDDEKKK